MFRWSVILLCFSAVHALDDFERAQLIIRDYAFDPQSRNTNAYDAQVRAEALQRLHDLERVLVENGFQLVERIGIIGYQQNGIPDYETSLTDELIQDEPDKNTVAGWQFANSNVFGLLTGFVLKNANRFCRSVAEHIAPDELLLFDDRAEIFQEHAFGRDVDFVRQVRRAVERNLGDSRALLRTLQIFWQAIFDGKLQSWSWQTLATQDIRFNVDYAQHLLNSPVPIRQFFVGPDITYPIEVVPLHSAAVTRHAQEFVQRFMRELKSVGGKKTAYVLCSLVDGVGKTTLLANVVNWLEHGDQFEVYERVDNTSSVRAHLHHIDDQTVVVDLPAQMSHSMIKPEGFVFVPVETVKDVDQMAVRVHVHERALDLPVSLHDRLHDHQKNCATLDIADNEWQPLFFRGQAFLRNERTQELRVSVPLAGAHSCGLKVIEPEQMLFTHVHVPTAYDAFLEDLVGQLRAAEVEQIVFVDMLSMYPRSSREIIRINFLLQTLKTAFGSRYATDASIYRDCIHRQEMYALLTQQAEQAANNVCLEGVTRAAMQALLQPAVAGTQTVPASVAMDQVAERAGQLLAQHGDQLAKDARAVIDREYDHLCALYDLDVMFQAVIRFDPILVVQFSGILAQLGKRGALGRQEAELWVEDFPTVIVETFQRCCDEQQIGRLCTLLRAQWYAALSNMVRSGDPISVPPLYLVRSACGDFDLAQAALEPRTWLALEDRLALLEPLALFGLGNHACLARTWGEFRDKNYCLDWRAVDTSHGLYAFGYEPRGRNPVSRIVDAYRMTCAREQRDHHGLPAAQLLRQLHKRYEQRWHEVASEATTRSANSPQADAARLFVRAIATLETLVKDPRAIILVRRGDGDDFAAALVLLEHVTLPRYFNVRFDRPLFDDYGTVEPLV